MAGDRGASALLTLQRREVEEGLRRLPERCRMLAAGLDNSENDPELVFIGLPFADVQALAQRDPYVYVTFARLRPEQFARLFRVDRGPGQRPAEARSQRRSNWTAA